MKYTIKLAKRKAMLKLNNESCRVIIEKAHQSDVFITEPGIFEYEGQECVRIPNERIIVPLTDITKIECELSRFVSDGKCWMEVDWE